MLAKSKIKKYIVTALVATVLFTGAYVVMPKSVIADTVSTLQIQIQSLLQQIATLQSQLAAMKGNSGNNGQTTGSSLYCYKFSRNLTVGMKGDDVTALQNILIAESVWTAPKIGATGYFGSVTKASLAAFQNKHAAEILTPVGLKKGTGYFGPSTRSYIASQCVPETPAPSQTPAGSQTPATTPTPAAAGLTVALADNNPTGGTLPSGSLYNTVLRVALTAGGQDVTVNGITVTRGGYVANSKITGVSAWDENGNRLGNIVEALTADGKASISFGDTPLTVSAGQTKVVTIKVNLDSSATSGTLNFSVVSASDISTANASTTINGTFPMVGATFSLIDGSNSLGDYTITAKSPGGLTSNSGAGNVEIGDKDRIVAKFTIAQNNSNEAIELERLTVYVEGTIDENTDVTNWKLVSPEGNVLATANRPVGRYVTFKLATPYVIDKGMSKDLTIKADITGGAGHYFKVHVQNSYDIMVKGQTTGAYIAPSSFSDQAASDGWFKMKEGTLTVSKSSNSPSGNVSPGSQDVVLAKFDLKANGERIEIRKMGLQIKRPAGSTALTGTVKVKDASTGVVYLSLAADTSGLQTTNSVTATTLENNQKTLSSYIEINSGATKTIEIVGTVSSNATSSASYTSYVGKFYVKRYSSNDYITTAAGPYQSNTLSVANVGLVVSRSSAYGDMTKTAGASNVKIGEYVFQASSADDLNITGITVTLHGDVSDLQNLVLKDGDGNQYGNTIGTPTAGGNTFSGSMSIKASQTKVVDVYADILSSANNNDHVSTTLAAGAVSAYGVSSGKSVSAPPSGQDVVGQTITIGQSSLTISKDADAPLSQIVFAGATGVEINKIKFEAKYEDLTLKKLALDIDTGTTGLSASDVASDISKVYLYDGSTLLGSASLVGTRATISSLNVTLPASTPKVLTVKVDVTGSGTMLSTSTLGIKIADTSQDCMEVYSSQGLMTSNLNLTSNAQSNYFLFTDAAPTIAVDSSYEGTKTGNPNAHETVTKIVITNNGARDITLSDIRMIAQLSGVDANTTNSVSDFEIYDADGTTKLADGTMYMNSDFTSSTTQVDGVTSTVYVKFAGMNPTQIIAANGGSKTFVIKANTLHIEDGISSPGSNTARLALSIGGNKGYDASNTTSEKSWADGYVTYSYTPLNGSAINGLNASDSVQVDLTTLTY